MNGLFKIATRLVSRRHACGPILELLGELFSKPSLNSPPLPPSQVSKGCNDLGSSNNGSHSSTSPLKQGGLDTSINSSIGIGSDKNWWPLMEMAAQVSPLLIHDSFHSNLRCIIRCPPACGVC